MDHQKALAVLLLAAFCASACAPARWALLERFREPGETNRDFPEVVWEQYDCERQPRPFFVIEENELAPARVRPGARFHHRLIYAMCPPQPTGVVDGRLLTRIRFKGDLIVHQTTEPYEIKPGRWVLDTSVELPQEAEPGVYAYEIEFRGKPIEFREHRTFIVQPR